MKEEKIIKLNNFTSLFDILYMSNKEFDILIDFHDRKKWIASKNITVSLISHRENALSYKYNHKKRFYYIIDKTDDTIKYICNIRGRYEYFIKGSISEHGLFSLGELTFDRNWLIGLSNISSDIFVDNGINNEDYNFPYVSMCPSVKEKRSCIKRRIINKQYYYDYIIKRNDNGIVELYDKETGQLVYICNIGKRYEYFFKGEYDSKLTNYVLYNHDLIVQLIPHKENKYIQFIHMLEPDINPYIVRERDDGGVDLISKEDNTIKYICNIGKRFYYIPHKLKE
jgi:hypothetical protein